jgi:hypothetical protein
MVCAEKWGRPPNFLIVDFYNQGPTSGSVFEAAAKANGVTYDRKCCGTAVRSLAGSNYKLSGLYMGMILVTATALMNSV